MERFGIQNPRTFSSTDNLQRVRHFTCELVKSESDTGRTLVKSESGSAGLTSRLGLVSSGLGATSPEFHESSPSPAAAGLIRFESDTVWTRIWIQTRVQQPCSQNISIDQVKRSLVAKRSTKSKLPRREPYLWSHLEHPAPVTSGNVGHVITFGAQLKI